MAVTFMHRDTKLGLALAILVMGFAAALCFPRESNEKPVDLALQSAAKLDEAIRLMPVKSYTDADRPLPRGAEAAPVEPDSVVPAGPEPVQSLAGVPDPIEIQKDPEPTPIEPSRLPAEVVAVPDPEPVVPTRTYRVKFGDNLSVIAERELGSHRYWSTLFNANRHLLKTENDLRPGMELIIPIEPGDEVTPDAPVANPSTVETVQRPVSPSPREALPTRATGRFSAPRTRAAGGATTAPQ